MDVIIISRGNKNHSFDGNLCLETRFMHDVSFKILQRPHFATTYNKGSIKWMFS